jgi:flagellar secretion chaperone FliS
MNPYASDNYLVTEVMTATPQKLQLMLIDAAIRQVRYAQDHWSDKVVANRYVRQAQKIINGILDGIDFSTKSPLVAKIAQVYAFIYTTLARAMLNHDEKKIGEALRLLEIEQETWRQLCEKLGTAAAPNLSAHFPLADNISDHSPAGFSLEA